jgi:hypothetical protein
MKKWPMIEMSSILKGQEKEISMNYALLVFILHLDMPGMCRNEVININERCYNSRCEDFYHWLHLNGWSNYCTPAKQPHKTMGGRVCQGSALMRIIT